MKMMRSILNALKKRWLIAFIAITACVDPVAFDAPEAQSLYVIQGLISTDAGPYEVSVSRGFSLGQGPSSSAPVENATITLFDDNGNTDQFVEISPGKYQSSGIIQGVLGHSYHIRVETSDGKIFESSPDLLNPVGAIQEIRYEFEARVDKEDFGDVPANVFKIFVDATAGDAEEKYSRWRFTGTYQVATTPELHMIHNPPYVPYKAPLPCSGYIVVGGPIGSGGLLEKVRECECCTCWAKHYEEAPQLSDTQLVDGDLFKNIKVAEVPVNNTTFHEKYLVEVEQMSLSKAAFDFFKLIRIQKKDAASIFQSPSATIKGNVKAVNTNDIVVGLFWATSIDRKSVFIQRSDVPYPVTPIGFNTEDCRTFFDNSSNVKPFNWE
jgi:hypothetical protein